VRGAVLHLLNEQPVVADLFGFPAASDLAVICTNVRGTTGKRPLWADDVHSIFYFPWVQIRFLEIPPDRGSALYADQTGEPARPEVVDDTELEIDEDFLRRVRDV